MRPARVLLADDSLLDIELTRELMDRAGIGVIWITKRDGDEVISFLSECMERADSNTPDLILLDLNLPKRDGLEVLAFLHAHPSLSRIPAIMLTGSDAT